MFNPRKRDDPTRAEWQVINDLRRSTLEDATMQITNGEPLPVSERWGWTAKVVPEGRDRDGCLRLRVWVRDPQNVLRLSRKLRLVPRVDLPVDLR